MADSKLNPETRKTLEEMYKTNQGMLTTGEEQAAGLNAATQKAYEQTKLENAQAQNKYAQNQAANQMSALDAIRRSNASAIANGANAGLSAANELSAILGLQEQNSQSITDMANAELNAAAQLNSDLIANAAKGQEMANEVNATVGSNNANLAASILGLETAETGRIESENNAVNAAANMKNAEANTTTADANMKNAEANTITAGANVTNSEANMKNAEANTITAEANMKNADANVTNSEANKINAETNQSSNKVANDLANQQTYTSAVTDRTSQFNNLMDSAFGSENAFLYVKSYTDPWTGEKKEIKYANDKKTDVERDDAKAFKRELEGVALKLQTQANDAIRVGDYAKAEEILAKYANFVNEINNSTANDACLAPGTLITLSDGSVKPVEKVDENDLLLVWDLKHGVFDVAPVMFNDHELDKIEREVITLYFSDGTTIDVIGEHGFFNTNLLKYVYIRSVEDAEKYIGHSFLTINNSVNNEPVQLKGATSIKKNTTAHSPCTYKHLCLYANGMLSMPGNTEDFTNQFKIDPKTYAYDVASMERDIQKYGLFNAKDLEELIPEQVFEAFQGQYLKVSIGKGLTDMSRLTELISQYSTYLNKI